MIQRTAKIFVRDFMYSNGRLLQNVISLRITVIRIIRIRKRLMANFTLGFTKTIFVIQFRLNIFNVVYSKHCLHFRLLRGHAADICWNKEMHEKFNKLRLAGQGHAGNYCSAEKCVHGCLADLLPFFRVILVCFPVAGSFVFVSSLRTGGRLNPGSLSLKSKYIPINIVTSSAVTLND